MVGRVPTRVATVGSQSSTDAVPVGGDRVSDASPTSSPLMTHGLPKYREFFIDALASMRASKLYSFDLETTGLDPRRDRITWFSFATEAPEDAWAVPVCGGDGLLLHEVLSALRPIVGDPGKYMIGWNLKFDLQFLLAAGLTVRNKICDGLIAEKILNETQKLKGLKKAVRDRLGVEMVDFESATGLFGDFEAYSKDDARQAFDVWVKSISPELRAQELLKLCIDLEGEVVKVIAQMEHHGIFMDRPHLQKMLDGTNDQVRGVVSKVAQAVGWALDLDSPQQVSRALFHDLKIPAYGVPVGKTGEYSTAEAVLRSIKDRHPVVALILEYRTSSKLMSSFLRPLLNQFTTEDDNRVHADFFQVGAKSGRVLCARPNLQQLPKNPWNGVRDAVRVPDGFVLIQADWSQVELRLTAWMSGDPVMLSAYVGEETKDIHDLTLKATKCGSRTKAKGINFGLIYGMGAHRLAVELAIPLDKATEYHDRFFSTYKNLRGYYDSVYSDLTNKHYVKTITGRRRRFTLEQVSRLTWMDDCHREAINFPVQGTGGDLLKIALRNFTCEVLAKRTDDPRWDHVQVVSLVHDEILVESPKVIAVEVASLLRHHMEHSVELTSPRGDPLPLVADLKVVRSWGESKIDDDAERLRMYLKEGQSLDEVAVYFPEWDTDRLLKESI